MKDIKLKEEREKIVVQMCKSLFGKISILYIGAHPSRYDLVDLFKKNDAIIDLLEVFSENTKYFREVESNIFNNVYDGNVKDIDKIITKKYDAIVWWHGPEHISKEALKSTLEKLEQLAISWILLGCPWGVYEQGISYGNKYEMHLNYIYPADLEFFGYSCSTSGEIDVKGSNITALKILK